MKSCIFKVDCGLLPRLTIPGVLFVLLLTLAGCGPRSAELESLQTASGSQAPPVSIDSGNVPVAESRPRDQRAPVPNTNKPLINAADLAGAALNGQFETVRQAIESGVDVNATDDQRRTPLMLASFNGHTRIVELLLAKGAIVDQRDAVGRTALMFAATGPYQDTVIQLLDAGAEINAVDSGEGFTALMHAAAEGQLKVVQILLEHQADPADNFRLSVTAIPEPSAGIMTLFVATIFTSLHRRRR